MAICYRIIKTETGEEYGIADTVEGFETTYKGEIELFHLVKTSDEDIVAAKILDNLEKAMRLVKEAQYSLSRFNGDKVDDLVNHLELVADDTLHALTGLIGSAMAEEIQAIEK